ncbi:ionotropic receptor 25a [Sitodiplosis mosellana]|uniref:ionotropic receptor 25a n=1 Tax=Sitodiplosis mosellana TaxID=263140 RepID=UPI00244398FD|nr:ionotropic receptor 25a [Sitodiplosis mosellana]
MCCVYLGQSVSESCVCNGKITLLNTFIRDLVTKLVTVLRVDNFKSHLSDCSALTNGSSDSSATSSTLDPNEFETRLMEAVTTSPALLQFYQNSTFNLEYFLKIMVFGRDGNELRMPTDESVVLTELAMIDNAAFSITPNISLKSPRRFFRIGVAQAIPWSYLKMDPKTSTPLLDEQGNVQWDGYCIDFAERLSEKLDFDYVLVPPTRGSFGDRVPGLNNTWDGLVGDLVTGQIDIAVAPMKMTAEREEVIDFVAPYFEQTGILIVIRKPVRQTSLFKFMTVLRAEVWLSIVGAIITTSIMLWILDKYSPYSAKNNKDAYPYPCRDFTFKESLWFSMTSFTPQGGGEAPKSLSSRTLVAAYWLFVVLMLATFTANLAAFLTVERMQTPVQSLDQLARQSRINYTVVEGSDTHKYFINMKFAEDTLYRMWKELTLNSTSDQTQYRVWDYPIKEQYGHILLAINSSNPVENATQGFQNVKDHINADYAFIHDSAEVKYEISRSCELIEVGEVFAEQPYALAIQQGSQLQDELSRAILELQKDRFFEALTAKYWNHSSKADECPNNDESEGITLESLGGVFIATLFGLALAMVTLVIEVVYYRRRDARENTVKPISGVTPPPSYDDQHVNRSSKKLFRLNNENLVTLGGEKFVPAAHSQRTPYIPSYRRRSIRSAEENEYIE